MTTRDILLEPMLPRHLDEAVMLSRLSGWPHRREDWAFSLSISDGIVALDGDAVAGTVLATPFGEDAGAVSLVIVAAGLRGRGLGRRLVEQALDRLGNRCGYLTATEDGLPLYEKLGFQATGEIRQHQGLALPVTAPPEVSWAEPGALPGLAALDRAAFGHDRAALMRRLDQDARFAVLRREGAPQGFAAIRPFGRGVVIGPVVAPDDAAARALIGFLLAGQAGRFVRLDTDVRTGLSAWLTGHGLAPVGGGITMRRGPGPRGGGNITPTPVSTFALASQALG